MSRFKSPQLAQEKADRLRRERRKETRFLVIVVVLMVVVAAAYGVWAVKNMKTRAKHLHQHSGGKRSGERAP